MAKPQWLEVMSSGSLFLVQLPVLDCPYPGNSSMTEEDSSRRTVDMWSSSAPPWHSQSNKASKSEMCYNTTSALLRSDLASPQITAHWGKHLTVVQEPCKHKCVPSYPQRRSRYAITQQHQSGCIHFAANSKDDYTWSSLRKPCSHLQNTIFTYLRYLW